MQGRPWSLPLAERVLIVAVYYRTNLTMRQLGPLFGVSSSTVCRVIQRLGPLLVLEPLSRPTDAADRLWIVDGTLVPVRDRTIGASSRNYRFSANVQVIVDADTRLMIAAARPTLCTTADAHAWRASVLAEHCQDVTVLGDGAYLNCGMVVPHRKRPRRPLLAGEEADNAAHRTVRARVEHVIGRMKAQTELQAWKQKHNHSHKRVRARIEHTFAPHEGLEDHEVDVIRLRQHLEGCCRTTSGLDLGKAGRLARSSSGRAL